MHPKCSLRVYMGYVNAIQKVSTTARWRSIFMYSHQFSFTQHIVEVRFAFDQAYKRWQGRNSLLGLTTNRTFSHWTTKLRRSRMVSIGSPSVTNMDTFGSDSVQLVRVIEESTPRDSPHKPEKITKAMLSLKLKDEPSLTICMELMLN